MKKQGKVGLAALCALVLVAGTALATGSIVTKTLQAQYMGIALTVDGKEVTPKDANGNTVEPFAVDGTVYLPIRAVGEAMGRDVEWNGDTHTVALLSPYLSDARALVETIESTHPCFVLNDVPEGYAAAKEAFLTFAAQPDIDSVEFAWQSMAYTAALKDGHTQMYVVGYQMPRLVVQLAADGDRLFLVDSDGKITAKEVLTIGGLPVKDAFAAVDKYFAYENQSYADKNHASWLKLQALLVRAGADCAGDQAVLTIRENGKTSEMTVEIAAMTPDSSSGEEEPVISHKMMGDVFYIDFNACVPGDEVDATAAALARAVKDGTQKVIIDVRGNGGGDSNTCEQLLGAMGMKVPGYGMYLRASDLMRTTYPEDLGEVKEDMQYERNPSTAVQNPAIRLVVLTDEYTFSSATMMGVFVQDGKLGTLVGRPSANAPSAYGDILPVILPNTQFQGGVSYKQFQRPDGNADQKTLLPDVETKLGEDALEVALDFLKNK